MADPPTGPLDARTSFAWMQAHPERLRALLREEDTGDPGTDAASDAAVRAHLRFAAEGLAHGAHPDLRPRITGMADDLGAWFDADRGYFEGQVGLGRGAIALEEHLLYGASEETEPTIHAALQRRVRLGAWNALFLRCLEDRLGRGYDGLAEEALQWSKARERDLAAAILQMHHRALTTLAESTGHPATHDERDQSSRAAAVRGHVRHVVEAAAHAVASVHP
jgi:hypothetical protein